MVTAEMEELQPKLCRPRFAALIVSARTVTPFGAKDCRLNVLIRQAFSNLASHASASRPSPSSGIRPALTKLYGETTNIGHARVVVPSSTQNDEEPSKPRRVALAIGKAAYQQASRPTVTSIDKFVPLDTLTPKEKGPHLCSPFYNQKYQPTLKSAHPSRPTRPVAKVREKGPGSNFQDLANRVLVVDDQCQEGIGLDFFLGVVKVPAFVLMDINDVFFVVFKADQFSGDALGDKVFHGLVSWIPSAPAAVLSCLSKQQNAMAAPTWLWTRRALASCRLS